MSDQTSLLANGDAATPAQPPEADDEPGPLRRTISEPAGHPSEPPPAHLQEAQVARRERTSSVAKELHPALRSDEPDVEPQRWYVLGMYAYLAALQGMQWMTYSASPDESKAYLHVSNDTLSLFLNEGAIMYLGVVWFSMWLCTRHHGLRRSILLAAALCWLGSAVRCVPTLYSAADRLAHSNVMAVWTHAGQALNAAAAPMVQASPSLLSVMWFPVAQRRTATAVAAMANGMGRVLAFQLGGRLVDTPSHLPRVLFLELTLASLGLLACALHMPDHPKHPPSQAAQAAAASRAAHSPSVRDLAKDMFTCLEDSSVLLLALGFGLNLGVYMSLAGMLAQVLQADLDPEPSNVAASEMGTAASVATMVGCIVAGALCDLRSMRYRMKRAMAGLCALGAVGFTVAALMLDEPFGVFDRPSRALVTIVLAMAALARGGVDPLCFEMGAELTHPRPASNVGSLLTFVRSAVMLTFLSVPASVLDTWAVCIMAVAGFFATLLFTQVRGRYHRRHAESMRPSQLFRFSSTSRLRGSFAGWFWSPSSGGS